MTKEIIDVDKEQGIVRVTIADERWYLKDKLPVPSVTWIAGSYPKGVEFYKWLAGKGWDESQAIKTAASDKGSKIHKAISEVIEGKEVTIESKYWNESRKMFEELTPEECIAVLSFVNWKNGANPKNLAWDTVLFSEKYGYGGTIDYACKIGDDYWIIDFKSGQYIWTEYELQVSAYRQAQIETGHILGIPEDANIRMAILQVGYKKNKNGFKFTEVQDKFPLFLHARAIWEEEHGGEKPNMLEFPIVLSEGIKIEDIV